MRETTRLRPEFAPETRFALNPTPPAPFRARQENELEELKNRLLGEYLANVWEAELNSGVRRAANEATALAWVNPYPLLVYPVLFEEKAAAATSRWSRQQKVIERSRELLAL